MTEKGPGSVYNRGTYYPWLFVTDIL